MTDSLFGQLIVNANYKGNIQRRVCLQQLHKQILHSKLHRHPQQLVIREKCRGGTLILFATGKLRVMGCIDELDATLLAAK